MKDIKTRKYYVVTDDHKVKTVWGFDCQLSDWITEDTGAVAYFSNGKLNVAKHYTNETFTSIAAASEQAIKNRKQSREFCESQIIEYTEKLNELNKSEQQ